VLTDLTQFSKPVQNAMAMMMDRTKSKPGVIFQYGGRPFSQTGSKNNVDEDNSSKFGMDINLHIAKQVPSLKPKPEIDYRLYLEKSI